MSLPPAPSPSLSPFSAAAAEVLSVSECNRRARRLLEDGLPLVWVRGEISNLTRPPSGHLYFTLKDADAQVRCTLWRNKAQLLGFRPENGQKVEARALATLFEARGDFQLNVETLRPAGQGDLFARFLDLKARLEAEGLFRAADKRPLPAFPRKIAVVTSPQAAAWRDVCTTLARRAPHVVVVLFPTPVQGEGAARNIAAQLAAAAASDCDLILLCRGGGSIEDLWAFNDENLARAIRASRLPVLTGIGHETDFTLADFAADLRAPTPTAAAEQASPERTVLRERLAGLERRLARALAGRLRQAAQHLDFLAARIVSPAGQLARRRARLAELETRLTLSARRRTMTETARLLRLADRLRHRRPDGLAGQEKLRRLEKSLRQAWAHRRLAWQARLRQAGQALRQLDPEAVLARGYALAFGPDGRLVRDSRELKAGDRLQLQFARGAATATVNAVPQVVTPGEPQ